MRTLTLGLALGGGGTKGAAHVGVMRVLDDAGIKVDAVAGTSIGSLYGGLYAVGRTSREMDEGIRDCPRGELIAFFRHRLKIRDDNRLSRRFYEALVGQHIENLPIKFAATASDIEKRCSFAITHGPIIDAIEASIAIPIIARPVAHQGRYLLDGGFWDAAPVDAAHALGADVIVAVELGHPYTLPGPLRRTASRFASRLEFVGLKRTASGVPFAIHAAAEAIRPGRTAHVVLRPNVRGIAPTPGYMIRYLEAGIAAAQEALPAIRALLAGESPVAVAQEYAPASAVLPDLGLA